MIQIDADALYRAITATGYKLLAYNLDIRTGEVVSHTLAPGEVDVPPAAPSVKPLPKLGGDLSHSKEKPLFGASQPAGAKPKLFADDDTKKKSFEGDFWKREDARKPGIFGEFKRESGSQKLAEIFGGKPAKSKPDPFAKPASQGASQKRAHPPQPRAQAGEELPAPSHSDDPYYPRIPAVSAETLLEWMRQFAKDAGDPSIRDELLAALTSSKSTQGFERVLRRHLRMGQQWERYMRKQALASAESWLSTLGIEWELHDPETLKP